MKSVDEEIAEPKQRRCEKHKMNVCPHGHTFQ